MTLNLYRAYPAALAAGLFLAVSAGAASADGHGAGGGLFSLYDANRDGALDRAEFEAYLERRRQPDPAADLWVFDAVDGDGDGRISGLEMVQALQREMARRRGR